MIHNFKELGEVLAEFENRLSYLENSQSTSYEEPVREERVVVHRHSSMGKQEYDMLQQTSRHIKSLENRLKTKRKEIEEPF